MPEALEQPALQLRTLRCYGELLCREPHWGGKLALACFEGAAQSGLAAAASLAGAASLTVDSDVAQLKAYFRDGAFDFLVTTLDEALRALKNEVRQRRALAIALSASPASALAEANDRGLTPKYVHTEYEGDSDELRHWLAIRMWEPSRVARETSFEDEVRQRWMRSLPAHQRSARAGDRYAWVTQEP